MAKIRVFVAIKPSFSFQKKISNSLSQLKSLPFSIKWVEEENLHLTLIFLGNIAEERLDAVFQAVEKGIEGISPFSIIPEKIIFLPSGKKPKVLGLSFVGEIEVLEKLQSQIQKNLLNFGFKFKKARKFYPHLTLGRIKERIRRKELERRIGNFSFPLGEKIKVDSVYVFQSKLLPQGPIYSQLGKFSLK